MPELTPAIGETGQPDPKDTITVQGPFDTDRSAANALEGLLFPAEGNDPAGDPDESGASAPDAGEEETPPTGDEEEGQSDPQQPAAAIEPPKSLTAEERAQFAKLPPDAQQMIVRREGDREKAFHKQSEEIATERKAFEAERQAIATQRTQYHQSLQQLLHLALPEAEQLAQINWDQLAQENPAAWTQLSQRRDSLRARVGAIQGEMARVQQQHAAELGTQRQKLLAEQRSMLLQREPDFADEAKAKKLSGDLGSYLQSEFGFTREEVGATIDNRLIRLGLAAMRGHQTKAAAETAQLKRNNTPPRVQSSGTTSGGDSTVGQRVKVAAQRFGRSGSTRDAALLLENFL